jgi:hypothetical protein
MQKRGAHPALRVRSRRGSRGFTAAKLGDAKVRGAARAVSENPSQLGKSKEIMRRLRKPVRRISPQADSLAAIMYRPDDGFVKTTLRIS